MLCRIVPKRATLATAVQVKACLRKACKAFTCSNDHAPEAQFCAYHDGLCLTADAARNGGYASCPTLLPRR